MIHIPNARVCVIDTETTGLEVSKGHTFVEVGLLTYDLKSETLIDKYVQRINPMRSIDAKAQEVHGISFSDVSHCPTWQDVAPTVLQHLNAADFLVVHNADFDMPFIGLELSRVGLVIPELHTVCTMKEGRWATPLGKNPNLGELCFALGVDYDPSKAHGAEYDISVTAQCFFKGLKRGFYKVPQLKQQLIMEAA